MSAQLALYEPQTPPVSSRASDPPAERPKPGGPPVWCASCRNREARYGFQPDMDDPLVERPQTLCFECFRLEVARRQAGGPHGASLRRGVEVAARAIQARLPLEATLDTLGRRRRRAQIAARRALGIR